MNILWITWKDDKHPEAGGAEVVCREMCARLIADGHEVTLLTTDYPGATDETSVKGAKVIRVGSSRYAHPFQALAHYVKNLRNKYDVVIEEVNGGAPYFAVFFGRGSKRFMLYHQLARRNWFFEMKPPMSQLGYYGLVPIATRLVSLAGTPVITISESTRQDLAQFGFKPEHTHIISEGISDEPVADIKKVKKFDRPTVLSHGGIRPMKRTLDQVKAFEIAKKSVPDLQMKISGSSSSDYGKQVLAYIAESPYKDDIEYLGRTTDEQRTELMQKSHAILVTSIEEGWGLIVTEANSQGTPAVAYDVLGLRDSVRHGKTGIITPETPADLAAGVVKLLENNEIYEQLRASGWEWSKTITFDQGYQDFKDIIGIES